jgi:acyl-ACP thioesterase
MGDIAGLHADHIGVGFKSTYEKGLYWVILYEEFEILNNNIKPTDDVKVLTWPTYKDPRKLEYEREVVFKNKDDDTLIIARSNWVLIDIVNRNISRAEMSFEGEYLDKTNYNTKAKRKLNLKLGEVLKTYEHKVSKSDLDHNRHMNNCKYLDIVLNMSDDMTIRKCEVAFIKEARLDDIIKVKYFKNDDEHCYIGYVDDSVCFECVVKE